MDYRQLLPEIIAHIEKKSSSRNWKQDLAELLCLSQNAIYKRLNGTTPFSIDELIVLAKSYQLPVADWILGHNEDSIVAFKLPNREPIRKFGDYLNPILTDFRQLSKLKELKVWYAANEIPLFWYFYFEPLILFKFYMWGRITWNLPYMQGRKFKFADLGFNSEDREMLSDMTALYNDVESMEFWNDYILDTTIHQINFCIKARMFESKEDLDALLDALTQLIQLIYETLQSGKKKRKGTLRVYHNNIAQTNTCILVDSLQHKAVYTVFKNPNIMISSSNRLVKETEEWFDNIKNHSSLLSQSAEERRLAFVNLLEQKVEKLKEFASGMK